MYVIRGTQERRHPSSVFFGLLMLCVSVVEVETVQFEISCRLALHSLTRPLTTFQLFQQLSDSLGYDFSTAPSLTVLQHCSQILWRGSYLSSGCSCYKRSWPSQAHALISSPLVDAAYTVFEMTWAWQSPASCLWYLFFDILRCGKLSSDGRIMRRS